MAVENVFGGTTAWVSDIDPGASKILAHHWPDVPNLGDIAAVDWSQQQPVDILTAGFPCQDLSLAGLRAGLKRGNRSGLWHEVARAIDELRPELVVIENVRGLLSADAHGNLEPCPWCVGDAGGEPVLRALGAVLGDLADLGFNAEWQVVRASDVGAPHQRERAFVLKTPTAQLAINGGSQHPDKRKAGGHGPTLADEVEHLLPTPVARDWKGVGREGQLPNALALLPTPTATPYGNNQSASPGAAVRPSLNSLAPSLLPTPRVTATRTGRSAITGSSSSPSLEQAVEIARGITPRELEGIAPPASWRGAGSPPPSPDGSTSQGDEPPGQLTLGIG